MHGLVFLIIFGGWEVGARLGYVNELILPAPTSIAYRLYEMFFVTGSIYCTTSSQCMKQQWALLLVWVSGWV